MEKSLIYTKIYKYSMKFGFKIVLLLSFILCSSVSFSLPSVYMFKTNYSLNIFNITYPATIQLPWSNITSIPDIFGNMTSINSSLSIQINTLTLNLSNNATFLQTLNIRQSADNTTLTNLIASTNTSLYNTILNVNSTAKVVTTLPANNITQGTFNGNYTFNGFFNITNSTGQSALFVNYTNGFVGLGTNITPTANFDMLVSPAPAGTYYERLRTPANDYFSIKASGGSQVSAQVTVGGSNTGSHLLMIQGGNTIPLILDSGLGGTSRDTYISFQSNGPTILKMGKLANNDFILVNGTGTLTYLYANSTSGYVGIGTSAPKAMLDVNGSANVNGNTTINDSLTLSAPFVDNSYPLYVGAGESTAEFDGGINSPYMHVGSNQDFLLYTQNLDQTTGASYWIRINETIAVNSADSPVNGSRTAEVLLGNGTNTELYQNVTNFINSSYTFSIWLKTNSTFKENISLGIGTDAENFTKMINVTNIWRRYSMSANISLAHGILYARIKNGFSNISAWGVQLEEGNLTSMYFYGSAAGGQALRTSYFEVLPFSWFINGASFSSTATVYGSATFYGTIFANQGTITINNSVMILNATNSRVGIGTFKGDQSAKLEIESLPDTLVLDVNHTLYVNSTNSFVGINTKSPIAMLDVSGNISADKISMRNDTNYAMDRCTLVAGACAILNSAVTNNTNIFCTEQTLGTVTVNEGVGVKARAEGIGYNLSTGLSDTSIVACMLIEPHSS